VPIVSTKPVQTRATSIAKPNHIAFIMDGNGRWARTRKKPTVFGHRAGADAVRRCVTAALDHGVSYLTLYAFSSENWRRAPDEVSDLTALLRYYLRHKVAELHAEGVRLRVIGELSRFETDLADEIRRAEQLTSRNQRLTLVLALSYGARSDVLQAARKLALMASEGKIDPGTITEMQFASCLQTQGLPDPDLIVRTSGEQRLSNFLLWESAYSELAFLDVFWPDFTENHFEQLLSDYASRERRYGGRLDEEACK